MPASTVGDRSFLRSARTVSILTLFSRVLGLVRDSAMAHVLGAGVVNDAFTFAWTIPNMFRRLFGEGALSTAFVPVFTRALERGPAERARRLANEVISALGLFLLLLVAVLVLALAVLPDTWLAEQLRSGSLEKSRLTVTYTQLLLPYLAVICVIAQFMAVMHALDEFAIPALSPVILNLVWLAGIGAAVWWGSSEGPGLQTRAGQGFVIVAAILVASLVQFAWHLPRLRALGFAFAPVRPRSSPELRQILGLMAPMLVGMGSAQVNVLADRAFAHTLLEDGGTTHLYYGQRLMQFPLGLVSVALVTTVFPALARLVARDDRGGARETAGLALRTNLLLSLPATVGLVVLARPIVGALYEGGEFRADSADLTASALLGYALGLPFAGTVMLLTRTCYAAGDVRLPMRVGLGAVVVNVALDLALIGPWGELGLALATSITSVVMAVALHLGVRSRLRLTATDRLWRGVGPALVLAGLLALVVALVDVQLAQAVPAGRLGQILRVLAGTTCGLALFAALAGRLCPAEWAELSALWTRRRSDDEGLG